MSINKDSFWKKFFNSAFFLFGAIMMAVFVVISYARTYYQDYQIRRDIIKLQENERNLQAKKSELLEILHYTKSTSFIEEKARTDLNMAKIGEKMAIINTESASVASYGQTSSNMVKLNNSPNYVKWWNYFMGE
jgi:cell division protein FtsB